MTVTASSFRANFKEFADRTAYPDSTINFWLPIALTMVNVLRWGTKYELGVQLFLAHNIVLEKQATDAANFGGVPGVQTGPVSGKSVDKVSVNYATAESMNEGAAHWNMTTYGTRFIQMGRLFGAGPVQVNGPMAPNPNGFGFGGWGPWQ